MTRLLEWDRVNVIDIGSLCVPECYHRPGGILSYLIRLRRFTLPCFKQLEMPMFTALAVQISPTVILPFWIQGGECRRLMENSSSHCTFLIFLMFSKSTLTGHMYPVLQNYSISFLTFYCQTVQVGIRNFRIWEMKCEAPSEVVVVNAVMNTL